MPYTVASPSPVPLPVVLRGEERLEDVRRASRRHARAGVADREHRRSRPAARRDASSDAGRRASTLAVSMREPCRRRGIASRALTARFISTCSIWPRIGADAPQRRRRAARTSAMSSPIRRRSIALDVGDDLVQVEHAAAASTCLRLKASSCRVERRGALRRRCGSPRRRRARDRRGRQRVERAARCSRGSTVSRLLKSCATPPASWPTASIFCAWRSCSSSWRRSSTSSATTSKRDDGAVRVAVDAALSRTQNAVPSFRFHCTSTCGSPDSARAKALSRAPPPGTRARCCRAPSGRRANRSRASRRTPG